MSDPLSAPYAAARLAGIARPADVDPENRDVSDGTAIVAIGARPGALLTVSRRERAIG
jgi:hypothetical protein